MPLPGQGAVPSGSLYNELTAATRRAFVPRLVVQMYFATPTLFYLMGNSEKSAGGLSQITIPIQGQSMVQGQFTGYGGGFNAPMITPGVQNAQFQTCYWVVPVPLPFGETRAGLQPPIAPAGAGCWTACSCRPRAHTPSRARVEHQPSSSGSPSSRSQGRLPSV